jgi:transposase
MTIIRQLALFDMNELWKIEMQARYDTLFLPISWESLLPLFLKHTRVGPPLSINYSACLNALLARKIEHIRFIKDLVKRLKSDLPFRFALGFSAEDNVPSEATFSRIQSVLSKNWQFIEKENQALLTQLDAEFDIFHEDIAIDATELKGRTQATYKHKEEDKVPHPYVPTPTEQLEENKTFEIPVLPTWGAKKNSKGINHWWFGGKGHFAVSTDSQILLRVIYSSAYVADMSVALPLAKSLQDLNPKKNHLLMDKGYDAEAIYKGLHPLHFEPIIDRKKPPALTNPKMWHKDKNFAPTCPLGYSYHYDSCDKRYEALKFKRPEHLCQYCELKTQCQKVKKIKQAENYRNYAVPARGSQAWQRLYNKRSSVERVNDLLKEYFGLGENRFLTGEKVRMDLLLTQLAYNSVKYVLMRLHKTSLTNKKQAVA